MNYQCIINTKKSDLQKMQAACGKWGIRTPGTSYPARQFSKLLVSATHPTFLVSKRARLKSDTKLNYFCVKAKFFRDNTPFFTHLIGSGKILGQL